MTAYEEEDELDEPEADVDLLEAQEGKGYGEDEGEREQALPDVSARDELADPFNE